VYIYMCVCARARKIGVHNNYMTCDWTDQNLFGQVDPIYKISHTICSMLAIRTVIIVKTKIFL
jgi:hypothetical protein